MLDVILTFNYGLFYGLLLGIFIGALFAVIVIDRFDDFD